MALVGGAARSAAGIIRLCSSSLMRSFSSASAMTTVPPPKGDDNEKKRKRKKKKNLFEVAQFLPNWGIGSLMAKNHWRGTSYKITKINLYKDGKHGKAWGVFHKNSLPSADGEKKISGVHKRGWRYLPELRKKQLPDAATVEERKHVLI